MSQVAVECGRDKARANSVTIDFQVADAFSLATAGVRYDSVLDSAFFHTLPEEELPHYTELLRSLCNEGAELHLFTFSKELTPITRARAVSPSRSCGTCSARTGTSRRSRRRGTAARCPRRPSPDGRPRTFEVDAPTDNLAEQMVDEAGNVVSRIWHMHAVLRPQENRSETPT
ncbi:class I SAM-dependent methyltransferase [Streptomyces sp. INA 01156]